MAHTKKALQHLTSCFAEIARLFGFEVNLKKTEVFHQPKPQEEYRLPHFTIDEAVFKTVHQFAYLGCTITSHAKIDREIDNRQAKSNNAFGGLYKKVWKNKHLKKGIKISVYRAVILTTLLYGSKAWVTHRHNVRLLERFHQRCLRIILEQLRHKL